MPFRDKQLRMVKRCHPISHSFICERQHEFDERCLFVLGKTERLDVGVQVIDILTSKIATTVIELDNF